MQQWQVSLGNRAGRAAVALLFSVAAALGQTQGGTSGGTSGGGSNAPRPSPSRSTRPTDQFSSPVFLSGRVVSELNRPLSEPVSVELSCGMRTIQVIHTDLGGYFTFTVGGSSSNFQSNMDFSASNEGPQPFRNTTGRPMSQSANALSGCELRIALAGYMPITYNVPPNTDMNRIEVGNIRLSRIGGVKGPGVSVTSLLVPKEAAREYERALKELQSNKPESARPHLERAVELYDRYAEAWNELGRLHLSGKQREKARESFNMAVAADADYYAPYLNIATMQVQDAQWVEAVQSAGRVLALDPSISMASYLNGIAKYNLNDLEEAEKSALQAIRNPEEKVPQVHALLAEIYMSKENYPQAALHARVYLQQAPAGPFAARMKESLAQMEMAEMESAPDSASAPMPAPAPGLVPAKSAESGS